MALGKEGRNALRAAVAAHPGWNDHRRNLQIADTSQLLTYELIDVALALSIDIGAVTGRTPASSAPPDADEHHKPRPHDAEAVLALQRRFIDAMSRGEIAERNRAFCASVFKTITDRQDSRATERQFSSISRILDRAKNRAESAATMEAAAMNAHSPATAATGDAAHQLAALIAQLGGQSINPEQVAKIVDERITAALKTVPSVKIECKGADGVTRAVDGHQHPQFKALLIAATSRDANGRHPNIWLAGPAGSGKTHAVEQCAHAMGLSFHFNGAISNAFELLGFIDAGGTYHRTAFREAFEHGGAYLFDEVDGSDNSAILALNAALANGACQFPDGMIRRHPDCIVMASANTHGLGATAEYVGRARIDGAFLDRFGVRFNWTYDVALEVAISGNEAFARRVIAARERARDAGLKVLITPRASQAGAALLASGMTSDEAAELTYLANLSADQRRIVEGK